MKIKFLFFYLMLFASMTSLVFASCGCDDDNDNNTSSITDEELLGTWTIIDGYETNGETTYTGRVGNTIYFYANGTGSASNENIRWSRSGNHFSYYYTSNPSTVFSGTFSYSNGLLTMKGTGNGWAFEYKMKKTNNNSAPTLVSVWRCSSSTTTYKGSTYSDVLKGETLTINQDGTFKSTSSYIGKSGTWTQKENILYVSSTDGGNITLEFTLSSTILIAKGTNDAGESFDCTFVKE